MWKQTKEKLKNLTGKKKGIQRAGCGYVCTDLSLFSDTFYEVLLGII